MQITTFSTCFCFFLIVISLGAAAQERPVGYVDRETLENMRKRAPDYEDRQRMERSITVLNNEEGLLPLQDVGPGVITAVSIVSNEEFQASREMEDYRFNAFLDHVSNYTPARLYAIPNDTTTEAYGELITSMEKSATIIVGLHASSRSWYDNYGISPQSLLFIEKLFASGKKIVLAYFGPIQGLANFSGYGPLVWAPDDSETARILCPQVIFGAIPASGRLPLAVGDVFTAGAGDTTRYIRRLKYTVPEELGVPSAELDEIDSIVVGAIRAKAFPGAVVMAAKSGKVFYWKSFGQHEYGMDKSWMTTRRRDVFDLASITKVAATALATMKLQEEGLIDLDERFSTYVKEAAGTDKKDILIKEILTHQAGLIPFIRFWVPALESEGVFSTDSSESHPFRVAQGMYISKDYFKEVMWKEMLRVPLRSRGKYVYSDLSMYFMRAVVEAAAGERMDHYLNRNFYEPLGLSTMGFRPTRRLPLERLVPTEEDEYFRMQLLRGDVHDQGAAMAGGISGHAGLFSDANDLMIVGQLLLNGGKYGGRNYLDENTVKLFNTPPYKGNHRGLGFDKPRPGSSSGPGMPSLQTFGHTGFTGTCIWIDPRDEIVYIFLSNRVNPDADNPKLGEMEIRPRIQRVIHQALEKARQGQGG